MRIALVCGNALPTQDGVTDYAVRLAAALRARGHQVTIICALGGWGRVDPAVPRIPDALEIAQPWNKWALLRAATILRNADPDIVHVQFAPGHYGFRPAVGLLPALLAGGPPIVSTIHEYGSWFWQPKMLHRKVAHYLWRYLEARRAWDRETLLLVPQSSALLVSNAAHERLLTERFGDDSLPIHTIPVGPSVAVDETVSVDDARRGVRNEIGADAQAPILMFFGFLLSNKGLGYLLDAVALLRRTHPTLHLVIVGDFSTVTYTDLEEQTLERALGAQVKKLDLAGSVHMTGFQPEASVSRLLRAADVAVLPFDDGVTLKSTSLLTCLSHGRATVVTEPSGGSELRSGEHVIGVAPRDSQALARAIGRLLDDHSLRIRIGDAGREMTRDRTWETIAREHDVMYNGVVRANSQND